MNNDKIYAPVCFLLSDFANFLYRDSILVTFISEGTSIFAGFVIFTVLGVMAHRQGVHVSEVVSSGEFLSVTCFRSGLYFDLLLK